MSTYELYKSSISVSNKCNETISDEWRNAILNTHNSLGIGRHWNQKPHTCDGEGHRMAGSTCSMIHPVAPLPKPLQGQSPAMPGKLSLASGLVVTNRYLIFQLCSIKKISIKRSNYPIKIPGTHTVRRWDRFIFLMPNWSTCAATTCPPVHSWPGGTLQSEGAQETPKPGLEDCHHSKTQ